VYRIDTRIIVIVMSGALKYLFGLEPFPGQKAKKLTDWSQNIYYPLSVSQQDI
jgi:hypothetical protein